MTARKLSSLKQTDNGISLANWQHIKQAISACGPTLCQLCVLRFRVQVKVEKDTFENSYCSAMKGATGLQFYYVIADLNVYEKLISKYSKCNIFQSTSDVLNSDNMKVAFVQLCNELHACNFTMLQLTPKWVNNIF